MELLIIVVMEIQLVLIGHKLVNVQEILIICQQTAVKVVKVCKHYFYKFCVFKKTNFKVLVKYVMMIMQAVKVGLEQVFVLEYIPITCQSFVRKVVKSADLLTTSLYSIYHYLHYLIKYIYI